MADTKPIRVLQIVGRMDRGGIENFVMSVYRNIDREKVQFDFLAHYGREAAFNDEIRAMGGRIYEMPAIRDEKHVYYWKVFSYIRALNRFFREHREYTIIHGQMTNTAAIYMPIAKRYGVTTRIAHSHNTRAKAGFLGFVTDFLQRFIYKTATDWFACSKAAAYWFYPPEAVEGGKVTIIPNAVDADRFRFDETKRMRMRRELGVEGGIAVGCVARFRPEKNQAFLLPVLQELLKIDPDARLVYVGEGPCEEEVKHRARAMGLMDRVLFLGTRTDIQDVLQALDVFVLPSLWEGLPVAGIEAQASGLHCVVSDGISKEMDILGMVDFVPLDAPCGEWARRIAQSARKPRRDTYEDMKRAGYDIHVAAAMLQDFYLKKAKETEPILDGTEGDSIATAHV